MGKRENVIETYLTKRVTSLGGLSRKINSPSHNGVPDRLIITPGKISLVEVKTPDGKLSSCQEREIERYSALVEDIYVVYSKNDVDILINRLFNA